MLELDIPKNQLFDENTETFMDVPACHLCLEHSLISVRKWEAKYHKPFLDKKTDKTETEMYDYIGLMSIHPNPNRIAIRFMPPEKLREISDYIENPMTAATFNDRLIGRSRKSNEIITAETIYYWMFQLNIPVEFEKWHLQQLLALIKFIDAKTQGPKKMSMKESMAFIEAQNKARRAKYKTKG